MMVSRAEYIVDMVVCPFLCCATVVQFFGSLTSGPSLDTRGKPTTMAVVCPTTFLAHIWVGNASVHPHCLFVSRCWTDFFCICMDQFG
jgi:hypothetical protein